MTTILLILGLALFIQAITSKSFWLFLLYMVLVLTPQYLFNTDIGNIFIKLGEYTFGLGTVAIIIGMYALIMGIIVKVGNN